MNLKILSRKINKFFTQWADEAQFLLYSNVIYGFYYFKNLFIGNAIFLKIILTIH